MSLFINNDANEKKTDIIASNDIEISQNEDLSYEEYDSFYNEMHHNPKTNRPIKKTYSLNQLPKEDYLKTSLNYEKPQHISQDNCYSCKMKIYKKCNPTYHAYDKIWCFKCWKNLKINT
jgi:hypothetical protein